VDRSLDRALGRLCNGFAILGGLVLSALTVLSVASILSRLAVGKSVPGDFELVEMGCAVAVFAFLPYCHLRRGNVIVDFATMKANRRFNATLDALGGAIYLAIAGLLVWRLALGGADKLASRETTMILGLPIWVAFVPIGLSLLLLVAVVARRAWADLAVAAGRPPP
jgi:TRAP-type C4-dicarboxylate transport system permease small subunit